MSSLLFFAIGLQMKSIIFRIFFGICLVNIKTILQLFLSQEIFEVVSEFFTIFPLFGYMLFISGIYLIADYDENKTSNSFKSNFSSDDNQSDEKIYENNKTIVQINAIISELSNLQQEFKNKNLDLDIFMKFNLLNDKFQTDLQTTQDVVDKLQTIGQNDHPSHVQLLNHYLDLFKEQKQIIYHNIQQQCNEELDKINNQLHNFNEMMDKTV